MRRWVPLEHLAILVDEKLCKVPLDVISQQLALALLELFTQRVRDDPDYVHLGEDREARTVAVRKRTYLLGTTRFLSAELVAREGEDDKPLWLQFGGERLQLAVVCVRQPSLGGHVDHEGHLALVVAEIDPRAIETGEREIVCGGQYGQR